jgi:hypothetical protein
MKPVKGKIYEIVYTPTYPTKDEAYKGLGRCTEDSAVYECEVGDLYEFELLSGEDKGLICLYADQDIMSEKQ